MGIIETIKDVASLVQKADNIELYQKILELQVQVMGVLEENHTLRTRVRELEDAVAFQGALVFRDNVYVRQIGDTEDGPFCSKCWDVDRKPVRLQDSAGPELPPWRLGLERAPSARPQPTDGLLTIGRHNWSNVFEE